MLLSLMQKEVIAELRVEQIRHQIFVCSTEDYTKEESEQKRGNN